MDFTYGTTTRRAIAVVAGPLLALPAACSGGAPDDPRSTWNQAGITDYSFTLESSCGERPLHGRMKVTVREHAVVQVDGLDGGGRLVAKSFERSRESEELVPTINDIRDEVDRAEARKGSDPVVKSVNKHYGYPEEVLTDRLAVHVDHESCYKVGDFEEA